jgi:hypothetical protein
MSLAAPLRSAPAADVWSDVFPLPLTAFEAFMLADARRDYPLVADMELTVAGKVDKAAFDSALAVAVARNPLFACVVEHRPGGAPVWVPTDRQPAVCWTSFDGPLEGGYGEFIDLAKEPGLRIWVRQGADRAKILLHYHHACSDGLGSFAFVEDLLAAYATATGEAVEPRRLTPERLPRRGWASVPHRAFHQRLFDWLLVTLVSAKFLRDAPRPLAGCGQQLGIQKLPSSGPAFITRECPVALAEAVRRLARSASGTVNDVLLAAWFAVIERWNAEHGDQSSGQRLRLLMPQNLREEEDAGTPAANILSFAFLTRRASDCREPQRLLRSIQAETAAIKKYRLSLYFLAKLDRLVAANEMSEFLDRGHCFSTAVISNLGDPRRRFVARFPESPTGLVAGNLVLESIAVVPPLRRHTHLGVGIVADGSTFSINLKWDPLTHTRAEAERLLGEYFGYLDAVAGGSC